MYKIIGADQKEYGPVTTDQINTWILEGRANGQTLAQAQGSSEWKALLSYPEFASVLAAKFPAPPLIGSADPAATANWTKTTDERTTESIATSRSIAHLQAEIAHVSA